MYYCNICEERMQKLLKKERFEQKQEANANK